jgi:O-glycosyl hydrolase
VVGDSYLVSPRLWAFAHFSRFVRPGGKRIDATAVDATLGVSAFVNADKSTAVQVINNSDQDKQVTISDLFAPQGVKSINTWLTNNANNMTMIPSTANGDVGFKARVPARSIVSFVVPAHK